MVGYFYIKLLFTYHNTKFNFIPTKNEQDILDNPVFLFMKQIFQVTAKALTAVTFYVIFFT